MDERDRQLRRIRQYYSAGQQMLAAGLRGVADAERAGAASVLFHRLLFLHLRQRNGSPLVEPRRLLARGLPRTGELRSVWLRQRIDQSDWRIDDQASAQILDLLGRQRIHGDLLGALFESHINQKELGAYYTRDDITTYITEQTILPWLIDRIDFDAGWRQLRADPDRYRRGSKLNRAARTANDLVIANIDLRRLMLDVASTLGASLHQVLASIRVLDPTCGSGAFLFAAWKLLEELGQAVAPASDWRRSILARNLFGVDLMPEAVELCRMLALLKLHEGGRFGVSLDVGNVLQSLPWPEAEQAGFDVIIGNPPYLPSARVDYRVSGYATADCPDIYAWIMERSAQLLRPGGRSGLIVPLSLGFSERFATCRRMLFDHYEVNWFSSFGRIPDALFNFDVRIRNTIHLGVKRSPAPANGAAESSRGPAPVASARASMLPSQCWTTRLHRWFESERPELFAQLAYMPFEAKAWGSRVPKPNTEALAAALQDRLGREPARLADVLSPRPTPHQLHFKKTAYNWLTFCRQLPPCYDAAGEPIPHTQFDTWYFPTAQLRNLAYLFLNGKWAFAWWCIVGDDFHVARWMLEGFPIDLPALLAERRLRALVLELERAMRRAVSFKRNAGKRVGSYNLARCRAVTDRSDRIVGKHLGLMKVWPDVELLCSQVIKTDFADQASGSLG